MPSTRTQSALQQLREPANRALLNGILRGIEKEGLRATPQGQLALTAHPTGLGSALRHPLITTDYSEALLEFITPPCHRLDTLFEWLQDIHAATQHQLGDEVLWCNSMPCELPQEDAIPLALYGASNRGRMKTIYREGLGHRYGRKMQTVAGIHYNFSLPPAFWAWLQQTEGSQIDLQDYISNRYFDLIRNFRRHYWLLIYLFGATPAIDASFVQGREHPLETLSDNTFCLPYATSLRMGDLGYQSQAQESLHVCYNTSTSYVKSLVAAIQTPYPAYETLGTRAEDGHYRQLNTGLLQIENEFYSAIRPKRTAKAGETALAALCRRGVEYIEIRCIDIDPFAPEGITPEHTRFIDAFLLHCLLSPSAETDPNETQRILRNQRLVVTQGRHPDTQLDTDQGTRPLKDVALALLDAIEPLSQLLDSAEQSNAHSQSWLAQRGKVIHPETTPSHQVLTALRASGLTFKEWALTQSKAHQTYHRHLLLDDEKRAFFTRLREQSLAEQGKEERDDTGKSFDAYLAHYYDQYPACCSGRV
jgi:glutamate--cysteine ligase